MSISEAPYGRVKTFLKSDFYHFLVGPTHRKVQPTHYAVRQTHHAVHPKSAQK